LILVYRFPERKRKSLAGKAEGQGFAVERSETVLQRSRRSALKSVRTPAFALRTRKLRNAHTG